MLDRDALAGKNPSPVDREKMDFAVCLQRAKDVVECEELRNLFDKTLLMLDINQ
ncbi:MAG: hypothetical protein ACQESD_04600 [Thermoplasmatota archaeon]